MHLTSEREQQARFKHYQIGGDATTYLHALHHINWARGQNSELKSVYCLFGRKILKPKIIQTSNFNRHHNNIVKFSK